MKPDIFIGCYVKVLSLSKGNYGHPVEDVRQTAIGTVCRIVEPFDGSSDDGLQTRQGEFLVAYKAISKDGVDSIGFYLRPNNLEVVPATEELLLLYSDDLWQLIRPYGEPQDTSTFARLATALGYSRP
ncbi:hypothetical protein EJ070_30175 [Mesorhizobium sp. M1E.F.Ca.ET.045.02.1.1]|nr:hypothetical protein EJ070_30175 [Mesorhizobium sp. M1E.F.Ca.ET.045.02.1.1]